MSKFRVVYDDQPDEIVDKISNALKSHGLTIEYADGEDGYMDYVIVRKLKKE